MGANVLNYLYNVMDMHWHNDLLIPIKFAQLKLPSIILNVILVGELILGDFFCISEIQRFVDELETYARNKHANFIISQIIIFSF